MPRPQIDLSTVQEEITGLHRDGSSINTIRTHLLEHHQLQVSRASLYRSIKDWGLLRQARTITSDTLRDRIRSLFFDECLKDDFMLKRLRDEGFTISKFRLERIRLEEGLYRRQSPEALQVARERARSFFNSQAQISTTLQGHGRNYLYTYMRQQHHIISRDALYAEYRDFTPENVRERWGRTRYTRRDFSIHGPDWVWSIDGYDKLKNWGFEIYAGIDAYSRYITWFYCGFSSSTSWNVAKQYLHVLNQRHAMPRILRSDHGNETSLLCGIHYYLSGMRTKEQGSDLVPIAFGDCWYFGRSIHNTRIESWWHRLGSNRAGFWRLKGGSIILFDISQIVHTFEAGNLRSYIISLILLVNRIMPRRSHRIGFAYAPSFSMRIPRT
ncbi:hypothetical protein HRG_013937 [Hirsutella rhossiliensis]